MAIEKAQAELSADLVIFPELALCGYPPEDLLFRKGFLDQSWSALQELAGMASDIDIIVGYPQQEQSVDQDENKKVIYNAAALLRKGKIAATYFKQCLPNYSVFDEKRYFIAGEDVCIFEIKNIKFGLTICEDIWEPVPAMQAKKAGAEVVLNINASPFHMGKQSDRESEIKKRQMETGLPIVYVNNVGGQDELVFDGGSFVVDGAGEIKARALSCAEQILPVTLTRNENKKIQIASDLISSVEDTEHSVYQALVLGVQDYVSKNGFDGVVIGLSGGIDSALTLAIAVDALGAEKSKV